MSHIGDKKGFIAGTSVPSGAEIWYISRLCFLHESKNLNFQFFFQYRTRDCARGFISDRELFISRRSRQN